MQILTLYSIQILRFRFLRSLYINHSSSGFAKSVLGDISRKILWRFENGVFRKN